jgi:hypothetical protein
MTAYRSEAPVRVLISGLAVAVLGVAAIAQSGQKPRPAPATVSIAITRAPNAGPGETSFGEIRGTTRNAPAGSKVVI